MTFVQGLSSTLATVGQIRQQLGALGLAGGQDQFGAVLDQLSQLGPGPATTGGQGGGPAVPGSSAGPTYGYAFGEGAPVPPGAAGGYLGGVGPSGPAPTSSAGSVNAPTPTGAPAGSTSTGSLGQQAVAEAMKYLGVPYQWGGTNPAVGVDCSGLVQDVYAKLGVQLPRTSQQQALVGTPVAGLAAAQPGDLVFYPGTDGTASSPGHVGIYIGNGEMVDAPHTGAAVQVGPVGAPSEIRRVTGLATPTTFAGPELVTGGAGTGSVIAGTPAYLVGTFQQAANASGVPASLLSSVAWAESGFQPNVGSGAGAMGIMELMPATAASYGVNAYNPAQAIPAAAQLLAGFHQKYGTWSLALAAYNAGPGAVDQYGGIPPYPETQAYVAKVLAQAGMEGQ